MVAEHLFAELEVMTGVHSKSGAQGHVGVAEAWTPHSCFIDH